MGGWGRATASLAKIPLKMADIKVTATVRLHKEESGFFIDATLDAALPTVDQQQAEALVAKAHTICPYSESHWSESLALDSRPWTLDNS